MMENEHLNLGEELHPENFHPSLHYQYPPLHHHHHHNPPPNLMSIISLFLSISSIFLIFSQKKKVRNLMNQEQSPIPDHLNSLQNLNNINHLNNINNLNGLNNLNNLHNVNHINQMNSVNNLGQLEGNQHDDELKNGGGYPSCTKPMNGKDPRSMIYFFFSS